VERCICEQERFAVILMCKKERNHPAHRLLQVAACIGEMHKVAHATRRPVQVAHACWIEFQAQQES